MEGLEDAGPEAGLAPQAVAAINGVPWAELRWELVPGGVGAQHPEDAGQDRPGGSADAAGRCSWSEEWLHTDPLSLRQVRPGRHHSRSPRRCDGRGWPVTDRTCSRPREEMPATGDGLMHTPPPGPLQMKRVVRDGLTQQGQQTADLRYGERDQLVRGAPPFSPVVAVSRVTSRYAWASKAKVMWRCQASHWRTS
jgi:hypothetical protein